MILSPRVEDILNQVNSELNAERDNIKQKIAAIIQAILVYSKGNATAIATLFVGNGGGGGGDFSPLPAPTFDGGDDSNDDTNLDDTTVKNDDKFDFGSSKVDFKKNLSKDSNS